MHHIKNNTHFGTILRILEQRKGLLFCTLLPFSFLFFILITTAQTGLCIWFHFGWGQFNPVRDREWEEACLEYRNRASAPSKAESKANSP